jgi:hypothetical protein
MPRLHPWREIAASGRSSSHPLSSSEPELWGKQAVLNSETTIDSNRRTIEEPVVALTTPRGRMPLALMVLRLLGAGGCSDRNANAVVRRAAPANDQLRINAMAGKRTMASRVMAGPPDIARDLSLPAVPACEKEGLPRGRSGGRTVHT